MPLVYFHANCFKGTQKKYFFFSQSTCHKASRLEGVLRQGGGAGHLADSSLRLMQENCAAMYESSEDTGDIADFFM